MSGHDYLQNLLNGQRLSTEEENTLRSLRDKIEGDLRQVYGSAPRFYYGGSFGKKTMIKDSYDLDIVMYFPPTENRTLGQLYFSVCQSLQSAGYRVERKTVSLQLPYQGGFHIDVVPGKAQDNTFRFATLYKNISPPSTLQTSLKIHIDEVRRIREVVKLMKLWRLRHGIDVKTFALELLSHSALRGKHVNDFANSMWNVLEYIRDNILSIRLVDPANSNNIIELGGNVRTILKNAAETSCRKRAWSEIVW